MSETAARDDAALVAAAAAGDGDAFRELFRAYARPVYWLAHGLLGNAADAEDILQETFLVAWRRLPELELAGTSALPWLVTVCRFQAANRVRRLRRDREHTGEATGEELPSTVDVEAQVVERALVERILREVGALSALDQQIFRLCAADGYAYRAAAEHLGVTHAVVRNRLSRIRTRLRAAVEGETS